MVRRFQVLLHEEQARFLSSEAPYRAFVGGRGAGKSFVGAYDLLTRACAKRNRLYMVIAPTYNVLRDASMRTFVKLALRLGKTTPARINRSDLRVTLDSGSQVIFRSAENPERLRGPDLSGVWMDEAQGTGEEAFSIAIACLREGGEQGFLTSTFTPKGKRHWTYERFGKNEELRRAFLKGDENITPDLIDQNVQLFHCRTNDNPFLPPNFEHDLRRQYTSTTAQQELGGEFVEMGGTMFQRAWFSYEGCFVEKVVGNARRVRFWDKAASKTGGSFTAGALLAWDFDGIFYVEHVVHGQWTVGHRDEIIKLTAQLDAVNHGYGMVRQVVEQEPGPIWEEELVQMADGDRKKLKDVREGDSVINMDGVATRVVAVHVQGMLPSLRITTDTGRVIHAAPSHPFLTPTGWRPAGELRVDDVLALRCGIVTEPTSQPTLEECRLAGYFVGDGCCTATRSGSCNANVVSSDALMGEDVTHCAKSIGMKVHLGGSKGWTYYLSKGSREWLKARGLAGKSTANKDVPEWVMTASDECVANFIGAFFACDGCISFAAKGNYASVELYNTNVRLLEQVRSLLLRFGIFTRLRRRKYQPEVQRTRRPMHRLLIPKDSDSAARFAEKIPVFGKKRELLARLRRTGFDQPYLPDAIVSIEQVGELPCRCLTVGQGSSFLVNDVVVHNSGGLESAQNSIKLLAGHVVGKEKVTGKKHVRAEPFAAQCEQRNVRLVTSTDKIQPWISDFLDELVQFPDGKYSDQCDAASGAFNQLTKGVYSQPVTGGSSPGMRSATTGVIGTPSSGVFPPGSTFGHVGTGGQASGPGSSGGLRGFRPL